MARSSGSEAERQPLVRDQSDFEHPLKYERPFNPVKMEKFYWEVNDGNTKYKIGLVKFTGESVEELIYCGLKAVEAFQNLGIQENRYFIEFRKTLSGKQREYFEADRIGHPAPSNDERGFRTIIKKMVRRYWPDPNAKRTQIAAFSRESEFGYDPKGEVSINKKVARMRELFQMCWYLDGGAPFGADDQKHVLFGMFPAPWRVNFLYRGPACYAAATEQQLLNHMQFQ